MVEQSHCLKMFLRWPSGKTILTTDRVWYSRNFTKIFWVQFSVCGWDRYSFFINISARHRRVVHWACPYPENERYKWSKPLRDSLSPSVLLPLELLCCEAHYTHLSVKSVRRLPSKNCGLEISTFLASRLCIWLKTADWLPAVLHPFRVQPNRSLK